MENSTEMTNNEDEPLFLNLYDDKEDLTESPVLNNTVRKVYYQHMKYLLTQNLRTTETFMPEKSIIALAQKLELYAIQTCMSSLVYRHVMIKEINNIKKMTATNISAINMELYNSKEFLDFLSNQSEKDTHFDLSTEVQLSDKNISPELIQGNYSKDFYENVQPAIMDTHFSNNNKDEISQPKSYEQNISPEQNLNEATNMEVTKEKIATSTVSEAVYQRVYQEMCMMFSSDQDSSPPSPQSIIASNRFFLHDNNKFWTLEYENNKAQYDQLMLSMYELNKNRHEQVSKQFSDLFGDNTSDDKNVMPIKKLTQFCKERITWHVKITLNVYYKKKRFRSVDEFRMLAKTIVPHFLQMNPFINYEIIYKLISTVFDRRKFIVQNLSHIQYVESKILQYSKE